MYLKSNGKTLGVGSNDYGQLLNTSNEGTILKPVFSTKGVESFVIKVSTSSTHSLFLKADGTVWSVGSNKYGQLGDGTYDSRSHPVFGQYADGSTTLTDVVDISAGDRHSVFLKADGNVMACGNNAYGRLGDGQYSAKLNPVLVKNSDGSTFDKVDPNISRE